MCIYAINTIIQRLQTKAERVHALQIGISALVELQQYTFRAHLGHTDRLMGKVDAHK